MNDDKLLASSTHYYIVGSFEEANLYRKVDNSYITCVGDFYGNPEVAIIDKNERFCITAGYGVIVYFLTEPFETYMYNKCTLQWFEYRRNPEDYLIIVSAKQVSENTVILTEETGKTIRVEINNQLDTLPVSFKYL